MMYSEPENWLSNNALQIWGPKKKKKKKLKGAKKMFSRLYLKKKNNNNKLGESFKILGRPQLHLGPSLPAWLHDN
jgi:hypothetical protein